MKRRSPEHAAGRLPNPAEIAFPTPSATSYGSNKGGSAGREGQPERPSLGTMARKGLWPTPKASDADKGGRGELLHQVKCGRPRGGLWPTPTAGDAKASGSACYAATSTRTAGTTLTDAAVRNITAREWSQRHAPSLFPTPADRDWKSGKGRKGNGHTPQPPEVVGGQLNPVWVEVLMGFPPGWTCLDGRQGGKTASPAPPAASHTASTDCAASATPSSLSSPTSSG